VFTIIKSHRAKHSRAQGMVEFALALPVFLLLMLGVIEFARLLVTYSAVYTASREAVRYGVAFGMSERGIPYWKDCQGIRETGVRVGTVGGVQMNDIDIRYDDGLVEMPAAFNTLPTCENVVASGYQVKLGHRMLVQVTTRFEPIVPLVNISEFDVSSTTARTFLIAVDVMGTPLPTSTRIHTYTATLDKTATAVAQTEAAGTATQIADETATQVAAETATQVANDLATQAAVETLTATYSLITPTLTFTPTDTPIPPTPTETPIPPPPTETPIPPTPTKTSAPVIDCNAQVISFAYKQALEQGFIVSVINSYNVAVQVRGISIWWNDSTNRLARFAFPSEYEVGLFTAPYTFYFYDPNTVIMPSLQSRDLIVDYESLFEEDPAIIVMLENDCFYTYGSWPTPTPTPEPTASVEATIVTGW
jgi:hypothetical protein